MNPPNVRERPRAKFPDPTRQSPRFRETKGPSVYPQLRPFETKTLSAIAQNLRYHVLRRATLLSMNVLLKLIDPEFLVANNAFYQISN